MCALSLSELSVEALQRLGLDAPESMIVEDDLTREVAAAAANAVSTANGDSP